MAIINIHHRINPEGKEDTSKVIVGIDKPVADRTYSTLEILVGNDAVAIFGTSAQITDILEQCFTALGELRQQESRYSETCFSCGVPAAESFLCPCESHHPICDDCNASDAVIKDCVRLAKVAEHFLPSEIATCPVCNDLFHIGGDAAVKVAGGHPEPVVWVHRSHVEQWEAAQLAEAN